jgi:hypothetical protein
MLQVSNVPSSGYLFKGGHLDVLRGPGSVPPFVPRIGWGFAMFSKSKYAPIFASEVCPGARLYWMLLVFSLTSVFEGLYPSNGLRELAVATGAANPVPTCEVKAKIDRAKLIECELAIAICAFNLF